MASRIKYLPFLILVLTTFWLRLANLGYSNYQGDEIKALFLPQTNHSLTSFLLDQRKGPMQFVITYLIKFINPNYSNEFITRLPFALAGAFAVIVFYKLIELHFGKKTAFYAAFFMATNGFFIALSRIVQYQSIVILFMVAALYFFTLAWKIDKWKITGIYAGFIFWAISILAHYDGVFILPFAGYLLVNWWLKYRKVYLKHLLLSIGMFLFSLTVFYIPFVLTLSDGTLSYWQNRISGGTGKTSSSNYLFSVYQPIYTSKFYMALVGIGAVSLLPLIKKLKTHEAQKHIALLAWILAPLAVMEWFINIPGTHIYTYILPATIVMGLGVVFAERIAQKIVGHISKLVIGLGMTVLLGFIFLQVHAIYVDNSYEYPWEYEQFLAWTLFKPTPSYHLSMFGFPYYRQWEEIGEYIKTHHEADLVQYYSTNERDSMARYYIPLEKSTSKPGNRYYVFIENPQSFTDKITNEYTLGWVTSHEPIQTVVVNGRTMARIYIIPNKVLELDIVPDYDNENNE